MCANLTESSHQLAGWLALLLQLACVFEVLLPLAIVGVFFTIEHVVATLNQAVSILFFVVVLLISVDLYYFFDLCWQFNHSIVTTLNDIVDSSQSLVLCKYSVPTIIIPHVHACNAFHLEFFLRGGGGGGAKWLFRHTKGGKCYMPKPHYKSQGGGGQTSS